MTADPGRRLSAVDLLDVDEHVELDDIGNRALLARPTATQVSIPALFAEQVKRYPDAVAVTFGNRSLTYRELDEAANRLAHWLIGHGAGPGKRVALLFSRSVEAIVSILGVLKSGAAYVAIDPAAPQARIGFILDDAAPIAAVTTAGLAELLEGRGSCRSSMSRIRGFPAVRAIHRLRLRLTTSHTSSTPLARPVCPRGWPSPIKT